MVWFYLMMLGTAQNGKLRAHCPYFVHWTPPCYVESPGLTNGDACYSLEIFLFVVTRKLVMLSERVNGPDRREGAKESLVCPGPISLVGGRYNTPSASSFMLPALGSEVPAKLCAAEMVREKHDSPLKPTPVARHNRTIRLRRDPLPG